MKLYKILFLVGVGGNFPGGVYFRGVILRGAFFLAPVFDCLCENRIFFAREIFISKVILKGLGKEASSVFLKQKGLHFD